MTKQGYLPIKNPSKIRNLDYLAPDGSHVGLWQDRKHPERFFTAKTTKHKGWSDVKNRSHITGPLTRSEAISTLKRYGRLGKLVVEHAFYNPTTAHEHEIIVTPTGIEKAEPHPVAEPDVHETTTAAWPSDPMIVSMIEKAALRTPERNNALIQEIRNEITDLNKRLTIGKVADPARAEFSIKRKTAMIEACQFANDHVLTTTA